MPARLATVEEYLDSFAPEIRAILAQVRQAIHDGMPGSHEKIRYGMPAVMIADRYGLHFAGWKKHVGLYPVPVLHGELESEVTPYRSAKDSVNFQYSASVPYDLITRIAADIRGRRVDPGSASE